MDVMASAFFQLFSLLAIILPVLGGILLLSFLWRMTKALEGILQELRRINGFSEKWVESQPNSTKEQ